MTQQVEISIDGDAIRFTPNGKVCVTDAIRLVTGGGDEAGHAWTHLVNENPHLLELCTYHTFEGRQSRAVVGSDEWDQIETLLLDYLISRTS